VHHLCDEAIHECNCSEVCKPTVGFAAMRATSGRLRLRLQRTTRAVVASPQIGNRTDPPLRQRPPVIPHDPHKSGLAHHPSPSISIASRHSGRIGQLRGFLHRGLFDACLYARRRTHIPADDGRHRTTLNACRQSQPGEFQAVYADRGRQHAAIYRRSRKIFECPLACELEPVALGP
jgi:hypothetical protein